MHTEAMVRHNSTPAGLAKMRLIDLTYCWHVRGATRIIVCCWLENNDMTLLEKHLAASCKVIAYFQYDHVKLLLGIYQEK